MQHRQPQRVFTTPPAREVFNSQVWDIVARIPQGKVLTYGSIGAMIPRPRGLRARYYNATRARWVGKAMADCPPGLPWHRVINSQGKISIRSGNDHHILQRTLLEAEGVRFDHAGRIDLEQHLWQR